MESLRPWAAAGIAYVLADEPVCLTGDTATAAAGSPAFSAQTPSFSEGSAPAHDTRPPFAAPRPAGQNAVPAKPATSAAPATRAQNAAKTATPAAPVTFASRNSVPADIQDWPEPWRGQLLKTKPAPVIWTYHELGLDLAGLGGPSARGALFRKIIAELNLPKGSSAFWPCAMPDPAAAEQLALKSAPTLFTAGLMRLSPLVLILSGKQALADAGLESAKLAPFTQTVIEGKLLVAVPDTADLLHDAAQVGTTVTFLQIVLQSLGLQQRES